MPRVAFIGLGNMGGGMAANLAQGIVFERRLFHGLFGTQDQKEGMAAFVAKRKAEWTGR